MPNPNTNRRQFMKASLFVLLALPFTGLLRNALAAKKEPKPEPLPAGASAVPATDAVALAIGYKADVKDVDFVKYPLRKKPEAKTTAPKPPAPDRSAIQVFTPDEESSTITSN